MKTKMAIRGMQVKVTEKEECEGTMGKIRKGKETKESTPIRNEGAVRSEAQEKEL